MVYAGCVFVADIHPSRTWKSGSFVSVRCNACVHRVDLGLSSFWGMGIRTHVISMGKIASAGGEKKSLQRMIKPTTLHPAGQRAQHTTNSGGCNSPVTNSPSDTSVRAVTSDLTWIPHVPPGRTRTGLVNVHASTPAQTFCCGFVWLHNHCNKTLPGVSENENFFAFSRYIYPTTFENPRSPGACTLQALSLTCYFCFIAQLVLSQHTGKLAQTYVLCWNIEAKVTTAGKAYSSVHGTALDILKVSPFPAQQRVFNCTTRMTKVVCCQPAHSRIPASQANVGPSSLKRHYRKQVPRNVECVTDR